MPPKYVVSRIVPESRFGGAASAGASAGAGVPAMTLTGQFVGSLPWASPEQAEGIPSKIDLRTDVYSLGVMLYQMLTGRFPYEVIGNMRDVLDRIMRAAPVRPSTVRGTGASRAERINDEVETIVLKCLQKERERRYQSAGELARDIHHYLRGEPIEAKRDSVGYVLSKTLRRFKLPAGIAQTVQELAEAYFIGKDPFDIEAHHAQFFAAQKAPDKQGAKKQAQRHHGQNEWPGGSRVGRWVRH